METVIDGCVFEERTQYGIGWFEDGEWHVTQYTFFSLDYAIEAMKHLPHPPDVELKLFSRRVDVHEWKPVQMGVDYGK